MESLVTVTLANPLVAIPAQIDVAFSGVGGPRQVHAIQLLSVQGDVTDTAAATVSLQSHMAPIFIKSNVLNSVSIQPLDYRVSNTLVEIVPQLGVVAVSRVEEAVPGPGATAHFYIEPGQQSTGFFPRKEFGQTPLPISFDLALVDLFGVPITLQPTDFVTIVFKLFSSGNLR
jgi:hypothetical protein